MSNLDLIPYPKDMVQESDVSLARTLQQWAEAEVLSKRLEYREDYEKLLKPAMRKLFIDVELQKMIWPENCGGIGLNTPEVARTLALSLEQIGRADTGIGYLFSVTFALCSSFAMETNLNEELCDRIAPLFCQTQEIALGSLVLPAFGRGEHSAEGPLFRGKVLPARARRDGDTWVVNGKSLRPLNSGADAQLFGVFCALEKEDEPGLILVPGDAPGLTRGERFLKTGLAASDNADIDLTEVRVPVENLVFRGENPLRQILSWLYLNSGAVTVGSLFATYEIMRDWAEMRVIKGKGSLFKENPLTASLMAEISHEILLSRLLLHQLAQMLSKPELYRQPGEERLYIPALSVVSHITQTAEKAINQTMELMGSAGYATEWNLERYWRDVKTMQVHLGNWELNKMELARYFFQCRNL
ncbi:MAG: acyl-CoA dehydrogenase family protein [Bacillota bacterium]